jgi:ATP synthase I subunit
MIEEQHLARAIERIWKATFAIGAGGAIALFAWRGWMWGAGFALGSAISALNFYWLKKVATELGNSQAKPRMAVLLGLRYLILGGGAYGILKYTEISVAALLWGLFAAVAAVVLEILIELFYARTGVVDH